MPRLTIDGKPVEVPEGSTVLDAARKLGIEVPTLCFADGVKPRASCYVCVVQIEGRPGLDPACATAAADGMVVTSESDDVRDARRTALELLLSEHHGDCEGPCTVACPAGLDVPRMLEHLACGRHEDALRCARERILFNAALGRVCPRFCERACRRADLDDSVAIAALQRAVGDAGIGAESVDPVPTQVPSGKKVAIIGAGPSGLTAAYFLLKHGHNCTVIDTNPQPGGLFRYGIPAFRLPNDVLDGEIAVVRRLGVEFRMNTRVGRDVSLDALRGEFDAVLMATGAPKTVLPEGLDASLLTPATDFLRAANEDSTSKIEGAVVVLGGGDMAVDVARTAIRQGAQGVTLVWAKKHSQLTAQAPHVDEAETEGVAFLFETEPVSVTRDADGRIRISLNDGRTLDADVVVAALDRKVDLDALEAMKLPLAKKGVHADRKTGATAIPDVFAAGECVLGATYGVRAVASARDVAVSIDQFVRGEPVTGPATLINCRMGRLSDEELDVVRRTADPAERTRPEHREPARSASSFDEVEAAFTDEEVRRESRRCIQCGCLARDDCKLRVLASGHDVRPTRFKGPHRVFARDETHGEVVYEPNKCILCGLCIRAAAEAGENLGLTFIDRGFATTTAVPFERTLAEGLKVAGEACVRICPTGALAFKPEAWKEPLANS